MAAFDKTVKHDPKLASKLQTQVTLQFKIEVATNDVIYPANTTVEVPLDLAHSLFQYVK